MRWLRRGLLVLGVAIAAPLLALLLYAGVVYWNGGRGDGMLTRDATQAHRPANDVERATRVQANARAAVGRGDATRILFGDLHVHTHYSADAALQGVNIRAREGPSPPADACDFARFCSQLDFWSINDHAESLTPAHWQETIDSVRQCDALAGDPDDPDLVSFLGWEWSHSGPPERHYGHKNVILRDLEPGRIPTRPIASASGAPLAFLAMGFVAPAIDPAPLSAWSDFHRYLRDVLAVDDCPQGVPVRELPADCRESAPDPPSLFAKLADWDLPALVIPHGLAWGITNPPGADLAFQLRMHDPRWQRLLEVYSGHGNSEVFRDFGRPELAADGSWTCPPDAEGMHSCCARAEDLVRTRCEEPDGAACAASVQEALTTLASDPTGLGSPLRAVPGTTLADWGACGQLERAFLPAFNYRPRGSAQYALALGSSDGEGARKRLRWGFLGSSDTHRSRPGTGYREFARELMTDGVSYPIPDDLFDARNVSFYYTGGLVAVHAGARDRGTLFDALQRRHVYATSGDRTLLWFDWVGPDGTRQPMGSEVVSDAAPRFEARALGALEQRPGCPEFVHEALPAERIATLCRGHCYHPGETRKPIVRIEVVRVRPQLHADEPIRPLVEDPWRSFACPGDGGGCTVRFDDPEFAAAGRESVYYVRAIQAPSDAVNGDPLRCEERDAEGRCVRGKPCGALASGLPDACLAPVGERAWSSPIFVDPPAAG